jgi:hypothetical protein
MVGTRQARTFFKKGGRHVLTAVMLRKTATSLTRSFVVVVTYRIIFETECRHVIREQNCVEGHSTTRKSSYSITERKCARLNPPPKTYT